MNKKGVIMAKRMKSQKMLALAAVLLLCCTALTGCFGEKAPEFEKGVLTQTSWESAYLNMKFTIPSDDYVMSTEEEMIASMETGGEVIKQDTGKDVINWAKLSTVHEMRATNVKDATILQVMSEKLMMKNLTEEQYAESMKTQLKAVTQIQYTVDEETETVTVVGREYMLLRVYANLPNGKYMQEYYMHKLDGRMLVLILSYFEPAKEEAMNLLNCLEPMQ